MDEELIAIVNRNAERCSWARELEAQERKSSKPTAKKEEAMPKHHPGLARVMWAIAGACAAWAGAAVASGHLMLAIMLVLALGAAAMLGVEFE